MSKAGIVLFGAAGMTNTYLSRIERGCHTCSLETIMRLAVALGVHNHGMTVLLRAADWIDDSVREWFGVNVQASGMRP